MEQEGMVDKEEEDKEREIAKQILTRYINQIAQALNGFCANHLSELKKTLITKITQKRKPQFGIVHKATPHEIKNQTIKDLIFVISEVANYLPEGEQMNQSKISQNIQLL
jgi:hypothetical protein